MDTSSHPATTAAPEADAPSLTALADVLATLPAPRLRELVLAQATRLTEVLQEVAALTAQVAKLEEEREQLQRESKRQAAPFRRPDHHRVAHPKRPGRAKGHEGHYRRPEGPPDRVVEVPLTQCAACGADLTAVPRTPLVQTIEEVEMRRVTTRLTTYACTCPHCHQEARSTHPEQVSTAGGAAGTHLGRGAMALAVTLNKQFGVTSHQTCRILREVFGLRLTPGGLVQACHRLGTRLTPAYEQLLAQLRQAPAVYLDETSWYVGAPNYWLHVAATPQHTVYHIDATRSKAVHQRLLGPAFAGTMVSDCLNIYDDDDYRQHKCYSHHGKAIADAIARHPRQGAGFLAACRALLLAARMLDATRAELPADQYRACRQALDRSAAELLTQPRGDPLEERVRRRLDRQRDHLYTFLDVAGVDATNNLAERQLRPAVIARKLSCGNRTLKGARTWQVLASLAATSRQQGQRFDQLLAKTLVPAR